MRNCGSTLLIKDIGSALSSSDRNVSNVLSTNSRSCDREMAWILGSFSSNSSDHLPAAFSRMPTHTCTPSSGRGEKYRSRYSFSDFEEVFIAKPPCTDSQWLWTVSVEPR